MNEIASINDEDLLRRSATGDEEAFIALYRRRQAGIYRFALHMSGSPAIAEEVTQEVFLAIIREGRRFDMNRGSAASYLFGVARNQVLKHLQRDRAYVAIDEHDGSTDELPCGTPGPLADLTRAEAIEAVRQAVLSLPAGYREIVILCDLEEMSYADAALALNVPVGTVRSRLSRGRALLLEKLKAAGKSAGGFDAMRCFA
jgi:RNA polymerase sigma-70 factor, ECF subfamily